MLSLIHTVLAKPLNHCHRLSDLTRMRVFAITLLSASLVLGVPAASFGQTCSIGVDYAINGVSPIQQASLSQLGWSCYQWVR
jgi:hypothetical protein